MFSLNEQAADLNMPFWAQTALDAIARRGIGIRLLSGAADLDPDSGWDFRAELSAGDLTRTYAVQVRASVQASTLRALHAATPDSSGQPMLITPYLPPGLAATCRGLGLHFADAAGNMYVDWGQVIIDVQGQRPAKTVTGATEKPGSLRSFSSRGLMVVFSLLTVAEPDMRTYRQLSAASSASLGTVQAVLDDLDRLGYLEKNARPRRLHRTRELFDRWVEAYLVSLQPKLAIGHYRVNDLARHLREPIGDPSVAWGGESAAALLDPHLVPSTLVIYSPSMPNSLLAQWKAHRSERADSNLFVRQAFWADDSRFPRDALPADAGSASALVPSLLIYAELLASADPRQLEAATRLRASDDLLQHLDRY